MHRSIHILLYQPLAEKNRILIVVTFPGHKSDQRVFAKSNLTAGSRRTIGNDLSGLYAVAL